MALPTRTVLLLAALLRGMAAEPRAQDALFALELAPGLHSLLAVDEASLQPQTLLTGVEFLPLQLAGAAALERLRADRPRRVDGPAPHVRLPSNGSLYRIRQGGATHLAHVEADGTLRLAASVPEADGTPALLDWIAVDPTGSRALVASTPAAGGNVLLVDLGQPASPPVDLTSVPSALSIVGVSLRVGAQRAWFVAGGRLWRADAATLGPAQSVSLALGAGDVLLPELATSIDGAAWAAVLAQQPGGLRHVHVVGPTGAGIRLTTQAADYDLPSLASPAGPLLSISADGSYVAWRRTVLAKELFVERVAQPGAPTQVTADAQFTDTIDNVGVLGFVAPHLLVFGAGEAPGLGAVLGSADVFLFDANAGTTQNLTLTAGSAGPPFLEAGQLEIQQAVLDAAAERLLLIVDPDNGDHALLAVPLDGQPPVSLLDALLEPPQLVPAGAHVLVLSLPEPPPGVPVLQQVHLLSPQGAPSWTLLGAVAGAVPLVFDRFAEDRALTSAAFVASLQPGLELPILVDLVAQLATPAWDVILGVSPAQAFTPSGRLSVGVGFPSGPYLFAGFDAPFVGLAWPLPVAQGFPLDG